MQSRQTAWDSLHTPADFCKLVYLLIFSSLLSKIFNMDTKVINKLKPSINPSTLADHLTSEGLSAGTKCALLKNLETVDHVFTPVKTCRYGKQNS